MVTAAPKTSARATREVILGIDPGSLFTGWGVVALEGNNLSHGAHGVIATSATLGQSERLQQIYRGIQEVIQKHRPAAMSLEKVFFSRNVQSALKLGQARGVALLAAAESQIAVSEYSATEIKVAVVGYGHATKEQIQRMVSALLGLRSPMRADAADGLAAAICHLHRRTFQKRTGGAVSSYAAKASWRDYVEIAAKR